MPHWLESIADDLPLITDSMLAIGGIILALYVDDLVRWRKRVVLGLMIVVLIGLGVRHFLAKKAGEETRTLITNTDKLLSGNQTLLEDVKTVLGMARTIPTITQQLDDVKRMETTKAQLSPQKKAAIDQEVVNMARTLGTELRERQMQYQQQVNKNHEFYNTSRTPTTATRLGQEEADQLSALNGAYRRDIHQLLDLAEHVRVLLIQGQPLTPDDKHYAEIMQKGLDWNIGSDFPAMEIGRYLSTLADQRLKK